MQDIYDKVRQAIKEIKRTERFETYIEVAKFLDVDSSQLCRWTNRASLPSAPSMLGMINKCPYIAKKFLDEKVFQSSAQI